MSMEKENTTKVIAPQADHKGHEQLNDPIWIKLETKCVYSWRYDQKLGHVTNIWRVAL